MVNRDNMMQDLIYGRDNGLTISFSYRPQPVHISLDYITFRSSRNTIYDKITRVSNITIKDKITERRQYQIVVGIDPKGRHLKLLHIVLFVV